MGDEDISEEKPDKRIKITLIGSSGVGKTCIIRRYCHNENNEVLRSTSGATYYSNLITISNKLIQIDLWDTNCQEKALSITKLFFKDANIVIIVYEITNKNSFEKLKTFWYPYVKEYGEKYSILAVVGNKSDLYKHEEVNEDEAREYAKQIGATFMLVSSKSGDKVALLFKTLIRQYLGPSFTEQLNEMEKEKGQIGKLMKWQAY